MKKLIAITIILISTLPIFAGDITITFTVPDAIQADVLDKAARAFGYRAVIGNNSDGTQILNTVDHLTFLKSTIGNLIMSRVIEQSKLDAAAIAATTAEANAKAAASTVQVK